MANSVDVSMPQAALGAHQPRDPRLALLWEFGVSMPQAALGAHQQYHKDSDRNKKVKFQCRKRHLARINKRKDVIKMAGIKMVSMPQAALGAHQQYHV